MSTEPQQIIRKGSLLKCPKKALNPFKLKWQSRWFVLFSNSEHGRVRIEYYDNEKNWQQEKGRRIIPLSNCDSIKIVRNKEYSHVIEIIIQDKTIHLAAHSKEDEMAWFKDLCAAVFGNSNFNSIVQVVKKPQSGHDLDYHRLDIASGPCSPALMRQESLETSRSVGEQSGGSSSVTLNDSTSVDGTTELKGTTLPLTSSIGSELSSLVSFESGFCDGSSTASTLTEGTSYPVTIRPTLASQKAGMNGTYLLQINPMNVTLVDIPYQKPVCIWPILYLRRYGRGRTKFSFEASEKCQYGKGVYTFNTLEGDSIFHLIDMYARAISARNQVIKKRTSMPDGFKPLRNVSQKLTNSDGKLIDKLGSIEMGPHPDSNLGDSSQDIVSLGPGDSVSQMGTLRKELQVVEEDDGLEIKISNTGCLPARNNQIERGMSIGSGISLEIAQNMSQNSDEHKEIKKLQCEQLDVTSEANRDESLEDSFDTDIQSHELKKVNVSTIQEETLAQTLESEKTAFNDDQDSFNNAVAPNRTSTPSGEENCNKKREESCHKRSKQVKRSSSLKLPSSLRRSNSTKDSSIKKSQSVKRSSSFRLRFFKSKTLDEDKCYKMEKKDKLQDSSDNDSSKSTPPLLDIDVKIAQHEKVKEFLAKAIEADMNTIAASERLQENITNEDFDHVKKRRCPVRHKSNEMVGNFADSRRKTPCRNSNSFAGYDYKDKHRSSLEILESEVKRKVELYEALKKQSEGNKNSNYTFWRRMNSMRESKSKSNAETSSYDSVP